MEYTELGKIDPRPRNFCQYLHGPCNLFSPKETDQIFFFVDTSVAGKLQFRYKMHVETHARCSVHKNNYYMFAAIMVFWCLLRFVSCHAYIKLSQVPLLFHSTVI